MKRPIRPPFYFTTFLVGIGLIHFIISTPMVVPRPYSYLGIIGIVFGVIFNIWGDGLFRKERTTVLPDAKPTSLVTHGPFSITRNPMYLGMVAILAGEAILFGSLAVLPLPIVFAILIDTLYIRMEELKMERIFGKEYNNYRQHVRRWI